MSEKSTPRLTNDHSKETWDIFICHAWEDKAVAKALADLLESKNLRVWFDDKILRVGDDIIDEINKGLASLRFGVVILSKIFFKKYWARKELAALINREQRSGKVILPVWHNVTAAEVEQEAPMLAYRKAISTDTGMLCVVTEILRAIGRSDYHDDNSIHSKNHYNLSIFPEVNLDQILGHSELSNTATSSENITQKYKIHIEQAVKSLQEGQYDEAISHSYQALRIEPFSPDAFGIRGIAHFKKGSIIDAAKDLDDALQGAPQNPVYWKFRAAIAVRQKNNDLALEYIRKVLELEPKNSWMLELRKEINLRNKQNTLRKRAEKNCDIKQYKEVVFDTTELIRLDPMNLHALHLRSRAFLHLGRLQEASDDATECLRINPNDNFAKGLLVAVKKKKYIYGG